MGKVCWDFPLLGTSSINGSNNAAVAIFKGSGVMDGLVREICQNSSDAKNDALVDSPVRVKFRLFGLEKEKCDVFKGLSDAVASAEDYWHQSSLCTQEILDFLNTAKASISLEKIPVLLISDFNTTGLNNMKSHSPVIKNYWDLLVNTEGISIKQDSNSAGSFGIGKNAPFAYSALGTVFYNTYAQDGEKAFEGVSHLVTTQKEHNGTMRPANATGKYLYLEDEYTGRQIYPQDDCDIHSVPEFARDEVGTDVAVVGFKTSEYPDWEKATAISVIKNFILALMLGKLEVEIESDFCSAEYRIGKDSLERYLFQDFLDVDDLRASRQIFETITKGEKTDVKIAEKDDLSIYVHYDNNYSKFRSRFRSTGMLINTTPDSLPHYQIVVVVNDVGEKLLSQTLRKCEPPQHTEWRSKNITDNPFLKSKAVSYLRKMDNEIRQVLERLDAKGITERMDGGVGNFLPSSEPSLTGEETEGLKASVSVNQMVADDGRVLYEKTYISAGSAEGNPTGKAGINAGTKKHKKRIKKNIKVVEPKPEKPTNAKGVAPGVGKVRIETPRLVKQRIYRIGSSKKYRLYVKSPAEYKKVFVQFFANRDDEGMDPIIIRNFKATGMPLIAVGKDKMGPFTISAGGNDIFIEFDGDETLSLSPVFTMEVTPDEK